MRSDSDANMSASADQNRAPSLAELDLNASYEYTLSQYENNKMASAMNDEELNTLDTEKEQALLDLETQQLATVEQLIESVNNQIDSLNSSLSSMKLQQSQSENADIETKKDIQILTEKENIASEKLEYEEKKAEYESCLKSYDMQNDDYIVKADKIGYFYSSEDVKTGYYIEKGSVIGEIYPEEQTEFYAQAYVTNTNIAKIEEGQEVKFEISSLPSSEYGYFTGKVEEIAKDVTVDQNNGSAYYIVKIKCDNITVKNRDGEIGQIKNGMAADAKIIVDESSVMKYLLEKINLID